MRLWERFAIEEGKLKGDNKVSKDLDNTYRAFVNVTIFCYVTVKYLQ